MLALVASGSAAQAASLDLTIGALLESTGPLSELGPPGREGHQARRPGRQPGGEGCRHRGQGLAFVADTQGDPQAALSAARTLVDKGASCLVGPSTTPESIAILNGITMQRKITLWPTATSTRLRTVKDGRAPSSAPCRPTTSRPRRWCRRSRSTPARARRSRSPIATSPMATPSPRASPRPGRPRAARSRRRCPSIRSRASFDSEAGQIVAGNPDAYVVIDYPETYAKLGAAAGAHRKFDAKKLYLPDAMSFAKVPTTSPPSRSMAPMASAAGSPTGTGAYKLFNKLWDEAGGIANTSLTANSFDAGILCFLSSVEAGSTQPGAIRDKVRVVTQDGAPQFTIENLGEAVKTAAAGKPIDYVGVSGAFRFLDTAIRRPASTMSSSTRAASRSWSSR